MPSVLFGKYLIISIYILGMIVTYIRGGGGGAVAHESKGDSGGGEGK